MKNIVILTGNELRHRYFRQFLSNSADIRVVKSYCEGLEQSLKALIETDDKTNSLRQQHLDLREQYEREFFLGYCQNSKDKSNPVYIKKGDINLENYVNEIKELNPDIIIAYGCSIINSDLLDIFKNRFINVHLGLSPYYRGSGTNYFPFVNNEPIFCGVTFMYIDKGIDTGKIIHQIRADVQLGDNIHTIGNRLIQKMVLETERLITNFDFLQEKILEFPSMPRYFYKNSDFTEETLKDLYDNFSNGIIENHLLNKDKLYLEYPLIEQDWK